MNKTKGITLIELIVALALLSIVFSVIFSFNIFGVRVFGKGSKVRIVPLGSKSAAVLKEYFKSTSSIGSEPLFKNESGKREKAKDKVKDFMFE